MLASDLACEFIERVLSATKRLVEGPTSVLRFYGAALVASAKQRGWKRKAQREGVHDAITPGQGDAPNIVISSPDTETQAQSQGRAALRRQASASSIRADVVGSPASGLRARARSPAPDVHYD